MKIFQDVEVMGLPQAIVFLGHDPIEVDVIEVSKIPATKPNVVFFVGTTRPTPKGDVVFVGTNRPA
jgi:hypothetical protein